MEITITGPRSVGKTTISKLVAKKLKLKYISSDEIGEKAMKKYGGLDNAIKSGKIKQFINSGGYGLILDIFNKKKNFVFDLSGGSFTSKSMPKASEEVRRFAKKKSIVFGLLPCKGIFGASGILFNRERKRKHFIDSRKLPLLWRTFKRYPRFVKIIKKEADFIIYTKGKKPEQIAKEIVQISRNT